MTSRATTVRFTWGHFLDRTFGLRRAPGVGDSWDPNSRNIAFPRNGAVVAEPPAWPHRKGTAGAAPAVAGPRARAAAGCPAGDSGRCWGAVADGRRMAHEPAQFRAAVGGVRPARRRTEDAADNRRGRGVPRKASGPALFTSSRPPGRKADR
jgi:hypothetical protein